MKNPFLDVSHLDELISQVVECGFDWSADTCMVALVCSIGALSESYSSIGDTQLPSQNVEMDLAMQFWDVAVRRLGSLVGENSLKAVQCLCLAG